MYIPLPTLYAHRKGEGGVNIYTMKKIIKGSLVVVILFFGCILLILSNQIGGFRAFIVSSASMEPSIPTGSLVLTRYTHPSQLQKSDVITFIPPIQNRSFVTHRITHLTNQQDVVTLKTKGDNNKAEDAWILAGGAVVGKVITILPIMGYFFSFTQSKLGILFFILLPAVFIILGELQNIIHLLKNHPLSS